MNEIKNTVKETLEQIGRRNSIVSELKPELCHICGINIATIIFGIDGVYSFQTICKHCHSEKHSKKIENEIKNVVPPKYIGIETDHNDLSSNPGSLFISGNPGSGKTVLACSIAKKYIRDGEKVKFINFPAFIMRLQSAYKNDKDNPFAIAEEIAKFYGVLIIDDLGAEKLTDFVKQIIYFIVNEREQRVLTTIITSNFTLGELDSHIDSRISSRIAGMCKIVKMSGVDRRIKK